jgi:hypothetical protein
MLGLQTDTASFAFYTQPAEVIKTINQLVANMKNLTVQKLPYAPIVLCSVWLVNV